MANAMSQSLMFNRIEPITAVSYLGGSGISIANTGTNTSNGFNLDIGTSTINKTIVLLQHVNAVENGVTDMTFQIGGIAIPNDNKLIIRTGGMTIGMAWLKTNLTGTQTLSFGTVGSGPTFPLIYRNMRVYSITGGFGVLHASNFGSGTLSLNLPDGDALNNSTGIIAMGGGTSTNPSWTNLTENNSFLSSDFNAYSEVASLFLSSGTTRDITLSSGNFLVASFR